MLLSNKKFGCRAEIFNYRFDQYILWGVTSFGKKKWEKQMKKTKLVLKSSIRKPHNPKRRLILHTYFVIIKHILKQLSNKITGHIVLHRAETLWLRCNALIQPFWIFVSFYILNLHLTRWTPTAKKNKIATKNLHKFDSLKWCKI